MNTLPLPAKRDVRRSFDAAADTYDDNAFLQREVANRLFERLDYIKLEPKHVLEIGCGTGYATQRLRARYPEATLTAIDLAPAMCARARQAMPEAPLLARLFKALPKNNFVCSDAEVLPFADESIDLIVSSLTLQWCDPARVAAECSRVLKPNGLVMLTTFGPDTLKELRAAFRAVDEHAHVNTFVDMHDIGDMLFGAGFADPVMDQEIITITYSELKTLMRELKGIGAHNVMPDRLRSLR
jgi:malonyl-CoA O-methyltransferase